MRRGRHRWAGGGHDRCRHIPDAACGADVRRDPRYHAADANGVRPRPALDAACEVDARRDRRCRAPDAARESRHEANARYVRRLPAADADYAPDARRVRRCRAPDAARESRHAPDAHYVRLLSAADVDYAPDARRDRRCRAPDVRRGRCRRARREVRAPSLLACATQGTFFYRDGWALENPFAFPAGGISGCRRERLWAVALFEQRHWVRRYPVNFAACV